MSKRSIEETFKAVKPKWKKGIPNPPAISAGVSSDNGDLASSLSEAGQQISQLQAAYQQQSSLIQANTQAVQSNTSAQGSHPGSTAGSVVSSIFGGALGFLSPIISGVASLFGGSSAPAPPLNYYTPPAPVAIGANLSAADSAAQPAGIPAAGQRTTSSTSAPAPSSSAGAQQITVNVNAMDSQSFMDRSTDIANAVREAMLNMHPINDVVSSL